MFYYMLELYRVLLHVLYKDNMYMNRLYGLYVYNIDKLLIHIKV